MIEVRRYLLQEKEKLTREGIPFNALMPLSDFVSIGTNDLVQYVMAAGREKPDVSDYYEAGNHLVLPALKQVIMKAKNQGKECHICGELAGNLKFTADLLNIGIKNFSVQPSLIPHIKKKILSLLKNKIEYMSPSEESYPIASTLVSL